MMPAQLPFELLALIIDNVASQTFDGNDDHPDTTVLRNCALVSSQLTTLCQKQLLTNVRIPFDKPHAISRLCQILDVDHPELGSSVKVLSVIFRTEGDAFHADLHRIIGRCTQVTRLTIGCDSTEYGVDWIGELSQNTRLALESVIRSPTCKRFYCYNVHLPLYVFLLPQRTDGLESIIFSKNGQVYRPVYKWNLPVEGPPCSSLRSLFTNTSLLKEFLPVTFPDGRHLFDFTNLEILWVDPSSRHAGGRQPNVAAQMLDRATCLRTLGLELGCKPSTVVRDILKGHAPCFSTTLTEIRVTMSSKWTPTGHHPVSDPFNGVLDGLGTLSGRNVLRSIHIGMTLETDWNSEADLTGSWLRVPLILNGPGCFPALMGVTVDVVVQSYEDVQRLESNRQLVQSLHSLPFETLGLHFKFDLRAQLDKGRKGLLVIPDGF